MLGARRSGLCWGLNANVCFYLRVGLDKSAGCMYVPRIGITTYYQKGNDMKSIAIDNQAERSLIREAMLQRGERMDKRAVDTYREARDMARTDLLVALMSAKPGELR